MLARTDDTLYNLLTYLRVKKTTQRHCDFFSLRVLQTTGDFRDIDPKIIAKHLYVFCKMGQKITDCDEYLDFLSEALTN